MVTYLPWTLSRLIQYSCHEPAFPLENQLHPTEPISMSETRWVKLSSHICLKSAQAASILFFLIDLAYENCRFKKYGFPGINFSLISILHLLVLVLRVEADG